MDAQAIKLLNHTTAEDIAAAQIASIGARKVVIHGKPYRNSSKNANRPARIGVYAKTTSVKWTPRFYQLSARNIQRVTRAAKSVGVSVEYRSKVS